MVASTQLSLVNTIFKRPWSLKHYVENWEKRMGFLTPIIWRNVFYASALHIVTVVWAIYILSHQFPKWQTILFTVVVITLAGIGVTAGVHRYFCHRSFKATKPLHVLLLLCYSMAGQYTIYQWVRDHHIHHKFSETSADPHNANRGFFFAHIGWFMMKRHPDVIREGKKLDLSYILDDPITSFHIRHFMKFKILNCFVLPMLIPWWFWDESWQISVVSNLCRYVYLLNVTWSVNSFAHLWGNRPYDKNIMPSENWMVSLVAGGEGWHNYHHTFPWDYKTAELPYSLNITTFYLNLFAYIGWAYDLRVASPELIKAVAEKRGEAIGN